MKKICTLLSIYILSSCSNASDNPICLPGNEKQRMSSQSLSLTTELFFKAYMSKNIGQRRLAEMYVIGVIDASEGVSWCGFEIASPSAIQEQVYLGLKNTLAKSPNERPSTAIKSKLQELLPCKEEN